ncbi:hypothetical protein H6P81_010924 [Aristolochia fimbriata]|uniref:Uncharacterized protein n=1 Tax=Aristolochia fimbriata TaxID=158543 RepID=A0AAV7EQU0_ARIFI|nr:hypothetical protein H6P81_010924 [Aristolochia fimbriata]
MGKARGLRGGWLGVGYLGIVVLDSLFRTPQPDIPLHFHGIFTFHEENDEFPRRETMYRKPVKVDVRKSSKSGGAVIRECSKREEQYHPPLERFLRPSYKMIRSHMKLAVTAVTALLSSERKTFETHSGRWKCTAEREVTTMSGSLPPPVGRGGCHQFNQLACASVHMPMGEWLFYSLSSLAFDVKVS